jgi:hypothetical protein
MFYKINNRKDNYIFIAYLHIDLTFFQNEIFPNRPSVEFVEQSQFEHLTISLSGQKVVKPYWIDT